MWSVDVLREEHRWILRLLSCLEHLAADSEREARLDPAGAAEILALFTHFADGLHQDREERFLFPRLLARARTPSERVEIGKLCGEHEEERRALRRMSQELLGAVYGSPASLRDFRREALRFSALHRGHVQHENHVLLPLAELLLTPADDETVMRGFVALEHDGPQRLKQLFERIQALSAHFGLDPAAG